MLRSTYIVGKAFATKINTGNFYVYSANLRPITKVNPCPITAWTAVRYSRLFCKRQNMSSIRFMRRPGSWDPPI